MFYLAFFIAQHSNNLNMQNKLYQTGLKHRPDSPS